ncbi:MAG: hypothetical protein M1817_001194 [Caeruleum heppii]|nr:MAG: hypothetical protein M1817_001194 [Caeruleum heppii]
MPVTLYPASTELTSYRLYSEKFEPVRDAEKLLHQSCDDELQKRCGEVFQSSFTNGAAEMSSQGRYAATDLSTAAIFHPRNRNGFVNAVLDAYNAHHALIIRPDDVWITILSQFNLYVNANAERLRSLFVAHEGRKTLIVNAAGTRYNVDFGSMAEQMSGEVEKNVVDPAFKDWVLPNFTTTTHNDVVVSSVMMMSTLRQYFAYEFHLACGIPSVTLLGEKSDWQALVDRMDKLATYGEETVQWSKLLRPVLERFVAAFDAPRASENLDFWQHLAHRVGGGSGPRYLQGWINAFMFFDRKGQSLYAQDSTLGKAPEPSGVMGRMMRRARLRRGDDYWLGDVQFHQVDTSAIPPAVCDVDVKLNDNGQWFDTVMVAGVVGIRVTSSGKTTKDHEGKNDTLQPEAGWWLCEVE